MFSEQTLDADSQYPQPGLMRCAVLPWSDTQSRELVRIGIANPDPIESTEGLTEFIVSRDQASPYQARSMYGNAIYRLEHLLADTMEFRE